MAGANLLEVKKLLGHHDLKMTERYAHLSPELSEADHSAVANPGSN
jgi:site-specific recombinase XerD